MPASRTTHAGLSRDAAIAWLDRRVNYERLTPVGPGGASVFGLGRMRRLLTLIGRPQDRFPVVHVAGTKGKGSTVAMVAAILSSAGHRTGCYLSPHVRDIEERISVDGRPISAADLVRSFATVIPAVERLDTTAARRGLRGPTWFEVVTAVAFDQFARQRVAIAVLETGLGGRLDATNVSRPLVSVITSISLDHMAVLGPTEKHIAAEKAGIIKRGSPVVCGARGSGARAVIATTAARRRAAVLQIDRDFLVTHSVSKSAGELGGGVLGFTPVAKVPGASAEYSLAMTGRHQADNAALAVVTVRLLGERGYQVPERAVHRGLAAVRLPARIEPILRRPLVVLDAAHNVASMRSLMETLQDALAAAAGRQADKKIEEMLALCKGSFDHVVVTRYVTNPRAAPIARLVAACRAAGLPVPQSAPNPVLALQQARQMATPRGVVCIAGSFFLATEINAR